jgi:hypothetical protein
MKKTSNVKQSIFLDVYENNRHGRKSFAYNTNEENSKHKQL